MLVCVLMKLSWLLELWTLVACGVVIGEVVVDVYSPVEVNGRVGSQIKLIRRRHAEDGVGGRVVGEVVNS